VKQRIRVLLVDDHGVVREGLRTLLAQEADIHVVGEAATGEQALAQVAAARPEVVLLDLAMPGMDGLETLRRIRQRPQAPQVVVLTSFADDHKVRDAVAAGAIGYLLKDVLKSDVLRAIRGAVEGRPSLHPEAQRHLMRRVAAPAEASAADALTPRERDVLELIARGHSNKSIASRLALTEGTVKGYVSVILSKLGVAHRTQAALYAVKHGLVPPGDPKEHA
jgi:DNA-binding NarL/FixJ family response regulator